MNIEYTLFQQNYKMRDDLWNFVVSLHNNIICLIIIPMNLAMFESELRTQKLYIDI